MQEILKYSYDCVFCEHALAFFVMCSQELSQRAFPRADRPGSYQIQITICHKNPLIVNHNSNLASQLCDMQLIERYIFNMCRHVASNYQNPPCQEFYRYFGLKNSLKSDFWAFSFKPGGAYLQPSELECPQIQFEWMQFVVTPATKLK